MTEQRAGPVPAGTEPAVTSGAGRRREVVDGHAAHRGRGVVALDPARDLARGAAVLPAARSPALATGDEVVDLPLLHPRLELGERGSVVGAGETADRQNGLAAGELQRCRRLRPDRR